MNMLEAQGKFYDDCRLRKTTGQFDLEANGLLDDVVIDMGSRWLKREKLLAKDWLQYLQPYFANATQEFEDMLRGKPLDLSDTIVIHE
ncbi:hypothetical protein BDW69DRAFT_189144 [Aspergillus filifer]